MCKLKSGLLFKNGVFVPDYDSHDKMLTEKGIEDTAENRIAGKFVRFELSPENDDPFVPIDMWVFKIDQDELPEWIKSDPEKYEAMARAAVKEWAENHIFIGVDRLNLTDGSGYYLKDCTNVTLYGNSTVQYMCGNSTVLNMCDNSTVRNMWGNSTVQDMLGSSTVLNMYGNSTVQYMCGNSTVRIAKNCSKGVNVETIILSQNATIKDCRTKTLYAVGDWKLIIKQG
ncbi:hypothetical protein [Ruthenibacterium lactatiformans]|uniref:hypothetical protein n=1 Tax=Ruthenibacterium lactatiformans TaxID=1550024 RepID=UPI0032C012B8